jgi:hypothetical protein
VGELKNLVLVESTPLKLRTITKKITKILDRSPLIVNPTKPLYVGSSLEFYGFEFDTIYTDGSWKHSITVRDHLSGRKKVYAGGAVILGKGKKYCCIHINIDIETESAFEVELISLLIAIDIAGGRDVTIYSDCKSALAILNGEHRGAFYNILSGWKRPVNTILSKVKAHQRSLKSRKTGRTRTKGSGWQTRWLEKL